MVKYYKKEIFFLIKKMEKEKNIIIKVKLNLMGNIEMEKE